MKGDDKIAVIGMAELPTGWFPEKSCMISLPGGG